MRILRFFEYVSKLSEPFLKFATRKHRVSEASRGALGSLALDATHCHAGFSSRSYRQVTPPWSVLSRRIFEDRNVGSLCNSTNASK